MKTVNLVSGGKTSGYIAAHYPADFDVFSLVCIDDHNCSPSDSAIIKYVNDKLPYWMRQEHGEFIATTEDDSTLTALMDLEQFIGREIRWVRGKSFDRVLRESSIFGGTKTRLPGRIFRYCTLELKMLPIFEWWFMNVGDRVKMRIGFRMNEYDRMERFVNNGRHNELRIPDYQSLRGQKKQHKVTFNYRWCSFPLIRDVVYEKDIHDFWDGKEVKFPVVSNCVGCFHKKPDTLAIMCNMHPAKMQWFARQEKELGMGNWLHSKTTYQDIIDNNNHYTEILLKESGASCDSGGCTD
jgi:hypothetical protein